MRTKWTLAGMAFALLALSGCKDCDDVCANGDLKEFTRVQCSSPPFMLCNAEGLPAKPLSEAEKSYVREHCGDCDSCNPCSMVSRSK